MRKFKDGEMVRVKKTGEIGKITRYKVFNGTGYYEVDNETHFMGRFRPQELEKCEREKNLRFKVGDKVEVEFNYDLPKTATVIGIADNGTYLVDFKQKNHVTHDGSAYTLIYGNYSKDYTCLYRSEFELKLIPKTKRVFDKFKYIEDAGINSYKRSFKWVDICHGNDVIDEAWIVGNDGKKYLSRPNWEIEVPVE